MAKRKSSVEPNPLLSIEDRLVRLEVLLKKTRIEAKESTVAPWQFLVRRRHSWRKQLYLKGRNLTARQLVGSVKANKLNEKTAAKIHHLPVAAVREALAYVQESKALLETEAEIEKLMQNREGGTRASQPVP